MECLTYCIANSIDLARLDSHYKNTLPGYASNKSRDVLKLSPLDMPEVMVFVFKNGTVVSWGLKRHKIDAYFQVINEFANKLVPFSVIDEYTYKLAEVTSVEPHDYFDIDCLTIENDSEELKLSLSYGFSQSVKLQYFEMTLEGLIEKYTPLIQNLSKKKPLYVTRQYLREIISEILVAKSETNLISNFLYHPKYFWQHPTLVEHYIMLERYLHLPKRLNAINHRLDTLNEIFDIFNSYLESRHAHNLEIIIIVLITIEILFEVLNFHF